MGIIELFILAVGLSMDAFAVSVCKGLAMKQCSFKKAAVCGIWFGGFQALMPLIGYILGYQFKNYITSIDHWIAFILLAIILSAISDRIYNIFYYIMHGSIIRHIFRITNFDFLHLFQCFWCIFYFF